MMHPTSQSKAMQNQAKNLLSRPGHKSAVCFDIYVSQVLIFCRISIFSSWCNPSSCQPYRWLLSLVFFLIEQQVKHTVTSTISSDFVQS